MEMDELLFGRCCRSCKHYNLGTCKVLVDEIKIEAADLLIEDLQENNTMHNIIESALPLTLEIDFEEIADAAEAVISALTDRLEALKEESKNKLKINNPSEFQCSCYE